MTEQNTIDPNVTPEHNERVKRAKELEVEKKKKRTAKKKAWEEIVGNKIIKKTKTNRGTYSKLIGYVSDKKK